MNKFYILFLVKNFKEGLECRAQNHILHFVSIKENKKKKIIMKLSIIYFSWQSRFLIRSYKFKHHITWRVDIEFSLQISWKECSIIQELLFLKFFTYQPFRTSGTRIPGKQQWSWVRKSEEEQPHEWCWKR